LWLFLLFFLSPFDFGWWLVVSLPPPPHTHRVTPKPLFRLIYLFIYFQNLRKRCVQCAHGQYTFFFRGAAALPVCSGLLWRAGLSVFFSGWFCCRGFAASWVGSRGRPHTHTHTRSGNAAGERERGCGAVATSSSSFSCR
jgi:hypothetical protein